MLIAKTASPTHNNILVRHASRSLRTLPNREIVKQNIFEATSDSLSLSIAIVVYKARSSAAYVGSGFE